MSVIRTIVTVDISVNPPQALHSESEARGGRRVLRVPKQRQTNPAWPRGTRKAPRCTRPRLETVGSLYNAH